MTKAPPGNERGRSTFTRQPEWGSSQLPPTAQHCECWGAPNCRSHDATPHATHLSLPPDE